MVNKQVIKVAMATIAISGAAAFCSAPASAQQQQPQPHGPRINTKSLEKATFYNAPREIQIIDDRPVVRDFREAPTQDQGIELPPGPMVLPAVILVAVAVVLWKMVADQHLFLVAVCIFQA